MSFGTFLGLTEEEEIYIYIYIHCCNKIKDTVYYKFWWTNFLKILPCCDHMLTKYMQQYYIQFEIKMKRKHEWAWLIKQCKEIPSPWMACISTSNVHFQMFANYLPVSLIQFLWIFFFDDRNLSIFQWSHLINAFVFVITQSERWA